MRRARVATAASWATISPAQDRSASGLQLRHFGDAQPRLSEKSHGVDQQGRRRKDDKIPTHDEEQATTEADNETDDTSFDLSANDGVFLAENSIVKAQYYGTLPLEPSAIALERTYNVSFLANVSRLVADYQSKLDQLRKLEASEAQKEEFNSSVTIKPFATILDTIPLTNRLLSTRVVSREQWERPLFVGPLPPVADASPSLSNNFVAKFARNPLVSEDEHRANLFGSARDSDSLKSAEPQSLFTWDDSTEGVDGEEDMSDEYIEKLLSGEATVGDLPEGVRKGTGNSGQTTTSRGGANQTAKTSGTDSPSRHVSATELDKARTALQISAKQLFNKLIVSKHHSSSASSARLRSLQVPIQSAMLGLDHKTHSVAVGPNSLRYAATSGRSLLPLHTYVDTKTDPVYTWGLGHAEVLERDEETNKLLAEREGRVQLRKKNAAETDSSPITDAQALTDSAAMAIIEMKTPAVVSSVREGSPTKEGAAPSDSSLFPTAVAVLNELAASADIPRRGSSGAPNIINHFHDTEKATIADSTAVLKSLSAPSYFSGQGRLTSNSSSPAVISDAPTHSVPSIPRLSELSVRNLDPATLAIFAYANTITTPSDATSANRNTNHPHTAIGNSSSGSLADQTFRKWISAGYAAQEDSHSSVRNKSVVGTHHDDQAKSDDTASYVSPLSIAESLIPHTTRSWRAGINFLGFFAECEKKGFDEGAFRAACAKLHYKEGLVAGDDKGGTDTSRPSQEDHQHHQHHHYSEHISLAFLRGGWPLLEEVRLKGSESHASSNSASSFGPKYMSVYFPSHDKDNGSRDRSTDFRRGALANRLFFGASSQADLASLYLSRNRGGIVSTTSRAPHKSANEGDGLITVSSPYNAAPPLDHMLFKGNIVDGLEVFSMSKNALSVGVSSVCAASNERRLWTNGQLSSPSAQVDPRNMMPLIAAPVESELPSNSAAGVRHLSATSTAGPIPPLQIDDASSSKTLAASTSVTSAPSSTAPVSLAIKNVVQKHIAPKVMLLCVAAGQHNTAIRLFHTYYERSTEVPAQAAMAYALAVGGLRRSWFLAPQLLDLLATRVALQPSEETTFISMYLGVILNTFVESNRWEEGLGYVKAVGLAQLTSSCDTLVPLLKLLLIAPPSVMFSYTSDGTNLFGESRGIADSESPSSLPQHRICAKALIAAAERVLSIKSELANHNKESKSSDDGGQRTDSENSKNVFIQAYGKEANDLFSAFKVLYAPKVSVPKWFPKSSALDDAGTPTTHAAGCVSKSNSVVEDHLLAVIGREPRVESVINALLLSLDACARHGLWRKAVQIIDAYHDILQPRVDVKKFIHLTVATTTTTDTAYEVNNNKDSSKLHREEDQSDVNISNTVAAYLFESLLKADRSDLPLTGLPELFLAVTRLVGMSYDIPLPNMRKGSDSRSGTSNGGAHRGITLQEVFPALSEIGSGISQRNEKSQSELLTRTVLAEGITRSAVPLYAQQHFETTTTIPITNQNATIQFQIGSADTFLKRVLQRREQLHTFFLNFAAEHGFGQIAIEHGCRQVSAVKTVFHPDIRTYTLKQTPWATYLRDAKRMFEEETQSIAKQIEDPVLSDAFRSSRLRYAAHPEALFAQFRSATRAAEQLYVGSQMPFLVFEDQGSGAAGKSSGVEDGGSVLIRPWQSVIGFSTTQKKGRLQKGDRSQAGHLTVPFVQYTTDEGTSSHGPLWSSRSIPFAAPQTLAMPGSAAVSPHSLAQTNNIRTRQVAAPALNDEAMSRYLKTYKRWALKGVPRFNPHRTTETVILPSANGQGEASQMPGLCDAVAEAATIGAICPMPIPIYTKNRSDGDVQNRSIHSSTFRFHYRSPSLVRMQLLDNGYPLRLAGAIGADRFSSAQSAARNSSKTNNKSAVDVRRNNDAPSLSASGLIVTAGEWDAGTGDKVLELSVMKALHTKENRSEASHLKRMMDLGSRRLMAHVPPATVEASQLLNALALQKLEVARIRLPRAEHNSGSLLNHPLPHAVHLPTREAGSRWTAAAAQVTPLPHMAPSYDERVLEAASKLATTAPSTTHALHESTPRLKDHEVLSVSDIAFGLPFHKLNTTKSVLPSSTAEGEEELYTSASMVAEAPPECVVLRKPVNLSTAALLRYYNLATQEALHPRLSRLSQFVSPRDETTESFGEPVPSDHVVFKGMGISYRPLLLLPHYAAGLLPCVPLHYGSTFGAGSSITIQARVAPLSSRTSPDSPSDEGNSTGDQGRLGALTDIQLGEDDELTVSEGAASDGAATSRKHLDDEAFMRDCSQVIHMYNIAVGGPGQGVRGEGGRAEGTLSIEATIRLERGARDGRMCLELFEQALIQCGWRVAGSPYHEEQANAAHDTPSAAYHYLRSEGMGGIWAPSRAADPQDNIQPARVVGGAALVVTRVSITCDSTFSAFNTQLSPLPSVGGRHSANVVHTTEVCLRGQ